MHSLPPATSTPRYRLGFPVGVLGAPLRSHDSRRWQNQPHLSVSLAYVRDLLEYLHRHAIHFYRLAGQLAPYLTHPNLPHFHRQIDESLTELAATGDLARQYGIRLTMHPGHYIQLSSPDPIRVERSQTELMACAALLDAMGVTNEAVIVIHVGGLYGQRQASLERFAHHFAALPSAVRARLALENDDRLFGLDDLLWLHKRTGIRLVFDRLHHHCHNPQGLDPQSALAQALATWPPDQTPKIHFSSPRTELRYLYQVGQGLGGNQRRIAMPLVNQHSDFLNPFEFIELLQGARAAGLRPFDIMLEAKAKELALLRLREQVAHFAPGLSALLG